MPAGPLELSHMKTSISRHPDPDFQRTEDDFDRSEAHLWRTEEDFDRSGAIMGYMLENAGPARPRQPVRPGCGAPHKEDLVL